MTCLPNTPFSPLTGCLPLFGGSSPIDLLSFLLIARSAARMGEYKGHYEIRQYEQLRNPHILTTSSSTPTFTNVDPL